MKRVVVITGGTSGIGLALKNRFEKDGDIVYSLSITGEENDYSLKCDVTNFEQVEECIAKIKARENKIDILINNAGYGLYGATELLPLDAMQKQLNTNFMGVVAVTKFALPLMNRGSKIVNISSACALFPLPYRAMYCASKSAVSSFSAGLKMEVKHLGIDVCSICPGDIKTPFIQNRVKYFDTNERYGNRIQNASEKIEKNNDKRMTIDYAVNKIYKVINKKKFKPEYIIGTKYKLLNFALKFFPKSVYTTIVQKSFGGNK